MSETYTTYGIGPDKQTDELQTLRDERDRLRTRALTAVERWRAQTNVKEGIAFRMAMKALEAALTPAGQRWTRSKPTEPGWYWWRPSTGGHAIVERYDMSANGLVMYKSVSGPLLKYPLSDGEFQGPLAPNEATE